MQAAGPPRPGALLGMLGAAPALLGSLLVPALLRSAVILRELSDLWSLRGDEEQAVLFI